MSSGPRSNPRATVEHVDPVTQLPAPPGPESEPSGRYVSRVRGRTVQVWPEELVPEDVAVRIDPERVPEVRARAEQRPRAKIGRVAATFRSAADGARIFIGNNEDFFARAVESDPIDHVRDWMDGIEVGRGRRSRKLARTRRGRELLDLFRGARRGSGSAEAVIAWILGQSRSRRWDRVDWGLVRSFCESLAQTLEAGPLGPTWYPPASGQAPLDLLREEAPSLAAAQETEQAGESLRSAVEAYATSYARARSRMTEQGQRDARRRLRQLRSLVRAPSRIAGTLLYRPGESDLYPTITRETERLEALARPRSEEDLDLPWENPGRHLRRAPIGSLGDEQLAELGYLIEVEVAGRVLRWRPGACVLLWSPRYRALVAIQGCRPGPRRATPGTGRAAAARRRWTGRDPDRERTIRVPGIRGVWSSLGRCVRTDYQSAKWGRSVPYTHDHGPGVRVYRYGGARPPWIWVIRGGQLRITADGIEG